MERDHLISPGLQEDDAPIYTGNSHIQVQPNDMETPNVASENDQGFQLQPEDEPQVPRDASPAQPWVLLSKSRYILFLVLLYMAAALFSWIVMCILTSRPITTAHYGLWFLPVSNDYLELTQLRRS